MSVEAPVWAKLVLAVLATWRLTHLLAREDGPADLVMRLRARLGAGWLGRLMDCFNCASLWVAAPMAWWLGTSLGDGIVLWLALSGAVCLLERVSADKLVIEPLDPRAQGEADGMLRTESGGVQQYATSHPLDGGAIEPARPDRVSGRPFDADVAAKHRG